MTIPPHIATFVEECDDLLAQLEGATLALGGGAPDADAIHLTFRIFHTIKGSAAMVGLTAISGFTHHVGSVLEEARTGAIDVTPALVTAVLAAKDHLAALVVTACGGAEVAPDVGPTILEQLAQLSSVAPVGAGASPASVPAQPSGPTMRVALTLCPRPGIVVTRASVVAVVEELQSIGACDVVDRELEPGWTITVVTRAPIEAILDRLIFIETDVELTYTSEHVFGDPGDCVVLFDDLVSTAALDALGPIAAPTGPATPPATTAPASPRATTASPSPPPAVASSPTASSPRHAPRTEATVRVAFSKLDRLVDLVSELVISRSRLAEVASRLHDPDLDGAVEQIERLASELRDGVLGTRMMPIGGTFGRFKRLVHDLAGQLDKQVVLVTDGELTELDKHMLDQLGDPLMHLVRNAVDHGIETLAARAESGKPAVATVRLAAVHTGEYVTITIVDDGRGLDLDAIRRKGIERGRAAGDHPGPAAPSRHGVAQSRTTGGPGASGATRQGRVPRAQLHGRAVRGGRHVRRHLLQERRDLLRPADPGGGRHPAVPPPQARRVRDDRPLGVPGWTRRPGPSPRTFDLPPRSAHPPPDGSTDHPEDPDPARGPSVTASMTTGRIKVLIVDDSATVRQTLRDVLESDPGIEVIATAADPFIAVQRIKAQVPDVIVLDIEMPRMDGLTFLDRIMSQHPIPVVICSTLASAGSASALAALDRGAVEIICKPTLGTRQFLEEARVMITQTIRAAAQVPRHRLRPRAPNLGAPRLTADAVLAKGSTRAMLQTTDRVVAVGASTGGTEALVTFLAAMPIDAPGIVVVQHMPEQFTASFARRLDGLCRIHVKEAVTGDSVLRGQALIAPGGRHVLLQRSGARYFVEVKDGPLVARHRPSVDVLFRSTARYAGANGIGVIMTGMGDDGARGMLEMKTAGARTIAQDEATSVVFGMPHEAIKLGGVDEVVPLDAIAATVMRAAA